MQVFCKIRGNASLPYRFGAEYVVMLAYRIVSEQNTW